MYRKIYILALFAGVLYQGSDGKDVNDTDSGRALGFDDLKGCIQLRSLTCFLDVSDDIVLREKRSILDEADRALALSGRSDDDKETEKPSELTDTIRQLMNEMMDIVMYGLSSNEKKEDEEEDETSTAVSEKDGSEENDEDEDESSRAIEGRKKKKKKIHKLIALIKLLILGAVIAVKLIVLLKIFAAHLQIKFLMIAFAGLLINAARFYFDLKKGHNPQKVIYYEHAQHQHHYEGAEDDWSSSGPSENYWGRSYEEEDGQSAHDVAYSKQKPYGSYKKKEDDSFSWWG
ncbi:uncharacterized protein LOC123670560 [Harmonia axyridis]|uniref:uncharacterized protein LOC123670560 n=1 Tax=Harmonia axyridis TaxID=115357 RepID=UPI001E2766CD|nr:uncharacterized protein LOC123670560 [Harmonia axyridis]